MTLSRQQRSKARIAKVVPIPDHDLRTVHRPSEDDPAAICSTRNCERYGGPEPCVCDPPSAEPW